MQFDLSFILQKKPDFYNLSQREQIKYVCFSFFKNNNIPFRQKDIKLAFEELNLVPPSHLYEEFGKLVKGKMPFLVKKKSGFVIHPAVEEKFTQEFLYNDVKAQKKNKFENIELFSKYDLHSEIKRVAFRQFKDGYYKEAIQNAFVEVIDQVKIKSGNPKKIVNGRGYELDGDDLVNRVFGCDGNQVPIIKFNNLSTSLERAEQRGIMNLFKGVVGIRDKKAHLNFIQSDPMKTIEYLSLASLLMRLLDENA